MIKCTKCKKIVSPNKCEVNQLINDKIEYFCKGFKCFRDTTEKRLAKTLKKYKAREQEREQIIQKKMRRCLYSTKRDNKKLEKEVWMRKVCKRHPKSKSKISMMRLGVAQINYDNI